MSSQIRVHAIKEADSTGLHIRTICGKEASQCRGYPPRPGTPGEYDTAICDRIEATPHFADVTCKRCLP